MAYKLYKCVYIYIYIGLGRPEALGEERSVLRVSGLDVHG